MVGTLSLLAAAPAHAARQQAPTGTIDVMLPETSGVADLEASTAGPAAVYGQNVEFETTLEGQVSNKAMVYITVVCMQGTDVVYQSSGARDASFPMTDQPGLEWDGGDASCEGWLIYRVDKGKSAEITMLDMVSFDVVGTTS